MAGRENIEVDGEFYKAQLNGKPGFLETYEIVTYESAENGDVADNGFDGYHSCEPDEYDVADGKTAVDLAVAYLNEKCLEFSGSDWWTDADGDQDYRTGDETRHSYHPCNFTRDQLEEIVRRVK
jgi:hypothetical protein